MPRAHTAHGRRSRGQAWQARPARWRSAPAPLCALASILSLALSACASTVPPPNLCHWSGEAAPPITSSPLGVTPPLATDGVVYVAYTVPGADQSPAQTAIAALRARDGALLWSVPDSNGTRRLAFADGILILLGRGIVGLRARDGANLWRARSNGTLLWAIGGGVLYAIDDAVYAFRITDGRLLWQTPVKEYQALSAPVVDGATVYVGSSNGFLMALRADTGVLLWKTFLSSPTSPTPGTYTPLGVVAGQLYINATGTGAGGLLRVNPADGASAGYRLPLPAATLLLDPLIVNGTLYVGIEVTPISRTTGRPDIAAYRLLASGGTLLWRLPANGLGLSMIARDAQTLYLQELIFGGGGIYAVRLADGAVLWRQNQQVLGRSAGADAATGVLFETATGVVDPCNSWVDRAPRIRASKSVDGSIIWTRALVEAMR